MSFNDIKNDLQDIKTKLEKEKANYKEKYDVFLSYRRDGGETMAILLRDRLTAKGYRVFLDVENLRSGDFNEKLLEIIGNCTDFIIVLSAGSLDRCVNDGDWVRREIAHALSHNRNVVPMLLRGFEWPETLPEDISQLVNRGGVNTTTNEFFDAVIDRLTEKFLVSKPKIRKTKKDKDSRHVLSPLKWLLSFLTVIIVVVIAAATVIIIYGMNSDADLPFIDAIRESVDKIIEAVNKNK